MQIGNDGTIPFRNRGERITFDFLLSRKYIGDSCRISFLRDSVTHEVDIKVSPRAELVPVHAYDIKPSYFVVGGLVFVKLVQVRL